MMSPLHHRKNSHPHLLYGSVDHVNEEECDGLIVHVLHFSIVLGYIVPYPLPV